ncbi:MAG: geranylgeranylglyceryl/heptaprenylglyceryl phosphate synthase, partial [Candidatus Marinimicrobia bacterium]|nr:geranylgeranylglyceryl/heptaprenylglyceryl phosphate synthase [Candidatus Neomarinimicrobiota bacterium]
MAKTKGAAYLVLVDPDSVPDGKLTEFSNSIAEAGADGILVGGSLINNADFESAIVALKESSELPVIIFPGSA